MTFLSPAAFIFSTFSSSFGLMNGPFFKLRDISFLRHSVLRRFARRSDKPGC
jgi:hypothetical protein